MTTTDDRLSQLRQQLSESVARLAELDAAAVNAMIEGKAERDISGIAVRVSRARDRVVLLQKTIKQLEHQQQQDAQAFMMRETEASGCHSPRTCVSFRPSLPRFSAPVAVPIRRASLSVASHSYRRQPALGWIRFILCLARRVSDVLYVFPIGPIRLAESCAQGELEFSAGPIPANRTAPSSGRNPPDADRSLSGLSAHGSRSEPSCLLATLAGAAILARWATMVLVRAAGIQCYRCRAL